MARFDEEKYIGVAERITEFYQDFPDGSIRTFLAHRDGPEVLFEARVYRTPEEAAMGIYTSGWAREVEGKGSPVNKTDHVPNCETSAIGRALAALGYPTSVDSPRRTELLRQGRIRREHGALLDYIREIGPRVQDGLLGMIAGEEIELREHIREQWPTIKEQYSAARAVADAIEAATGVRRG